jgi:lysophospholipase L1-like esterase
MSSATVTAGLSVKADPVAITIPNGAKYFINEYMTNASGLIYSDQVGDWTNGDRIDVGVSGIADHTVDCAAVTLTVGFMSYPTSITGSVPSNQASVCLLGDSMTDGQDDAFTGTSGDEGLLARSVGPSFGYINMGVNADSSGRFNASHTQRALLLQDCTTAVSAYGHNNFFADGETLVVMEANQQTMYGTVAANLIGSKTIIQTTLPPTTTSSDNWATLGNQTVSGFNASLAGYNSALRAATTGPTGGYFDVNSVVGTSTNTMFWITNGTAFFMTVDGVHPSPAGYALIQSSGIIDTTRMH